MVLFIRIQIKGPIAGDHRIYFGKLLDLQPGLVRATVRASSQD